MKQNTEAPHEKSNLQDPAVQAKLMEIRGAIAQLAADHGSAAAIIVTAGYLVEEMFRTGQPYYPIMSMYGPVHILIAAEGSTIKSMAAAQQDNTQQKREGVH